MDLVFEQGILERKAFLLMLFFGSVGTGLGVFEVGFQFYLFQMRNGLANFSLTSLAFSLLMNKYSFLLNPVLLFVAFYKVCGSQFLHRPARTLISAILGATIGPVLGWAVVGGAFALANVYGLAASLETTSLTLQSVVTINVLLAISAMVFATVARWGDEKQLVGDQGLKVERPLEISVASGVYVLGEILALCVSPFLFTFRYETGSAYLALLTATIVLVLIGGIIELFIGYGIFKGRRWGWLVGFGASLIGLIFNSATLALLAIGEYTWDLTTTAEALSASLSLCLELAVIGLLLQMKSRVYCRMVDTIQSP